MIFVALGANLGDAAGTVQAAMDTLAAHPQLQVRARSSLYQSPPWQADGPDYVNAVLALNSELPPLALLALLQTIERQFGRDHSYRNAPRTLDLDLLLYGNIRLHSPTLTLPHPRMRERAFVLLPLAEIAPDLVGADVQKHTLEQGLCRRIVR